MSRDFVGALLQLNAEKQVSREALVRALEEGIQAAYRRVAGEEDIFVRVEPDSGRIDVYRGRYVVDEIEDPMVEVTVEEARQTKDDARAGDVIEIEQLDGEHFGRIGAQTAKQIILQRIREVERDQVFDQFANREGELLTGSVSRVEPRAIILDVGKGVEAILATSEQSPLEHYRIGQPVKAFVLEVRRSARGPQILVSRTHKGFLRRLFELEVPEIHAGTVEVKAIAREAGSRSKVAVSSRQEGLDPVGATVGQRGARVQAVVAELAGEKIDVIPWNEDPSVFVANALSPAQVLGVRIDTEHRIANVTVPERMLSLAIGREGQNARLAARLTGWRIDIRSDVAAAETPEPDGAAPEAIAADANGTAGATADRGRRRDTGARRRGRRRGTGDRACRGNDRSRGRRRAGRGRRGTRREGDEAAQDDQDDEGRRCVGRRRPPPPTAPPPRPSPRRSPSPRSRSAPGRPRQTRPPSTRRCRRRPGGPRPVRDRRAAPAPDAELRRVPHLAPQARAGADRAGPRRPRSPSTRRVAPPGAARTCAGTRPAGTPRRASARLEHALAAPIPADVAAVISAGPDALITRHTPRRRPDAGPDHRY